MAGITGKVKNTISKKVVVVGCADNGIFEENIAITPQAVSWLVADCMVKGIAGVATLAKHAGADLHVVDLGLLSDIPTSGAVNRKIRRSTSNFVKEPAMSRDEAIRAIEIGIEETNKLIDAGYDLIATGEVGIANTTTSSAMLYGFTGKSLDILVGRGAGLDDAGLARKKECILKAYKLHNIDVNDPIDVLAKVGGFDIACMAGTYLACAARRKPVIMDGFISGAAAVFGARVFPRV
jgi:nicotinate-nucleotide--dimethylbenzimidazole phosphoribosyltransferase